ncbi:ATP-binding protein [Aquabacterium sp.]|uniref:sensor histidine kinase n=1 Tax=Aquabacterium sp. TaxID=1872578 RepID=UPI00262F76C8|nr:ATP-binding protein [Aquabacterium sp.]MDD2977418.1 7TM-DISM domain-containing protein [Aquabacterium sp.]
MFRFNTPCRPYHQPLAERRWWWLLACLAIALLSPTSTLANSDPSANLIVQQAFWEDASGQADWKLAQEQIYTPYRGLFSRGFTSSAHWIRLTLAPNTTRTALIVKPAWLDSVTLYDPEGPSTPLTLGDHHHADTTNAWPALGHAFELPPSTRQRDVWLRLQTTSSHVLMVSAAPMDQALKASSRELLWVALYTSVQVLILFLLTFMWWSQRDRLLGLYLVRHAVFAAYGTSYLGLPTLVLEDVLTQSFMHHLFVVLVVCVVPLSLRFDVAFLSLYRPHPFWIRLLKVIIWASATVMLILLTVSTQLALQINLGLVIAAVPVTLMTLLSTLPIQQKGVFPSRRVMLAYYAVVVSSLPLGLVSLLGKGGFQAWGLYGLIVHGLITGLLMSTMLLVRSQRLAKHHQQVRWELRKSQQDMALEQRRRAEQSQFLHMLMHELKTPLSIVSMAIGTRSNREENLEHAGRAVRDMKAIIERCVQADQIGELTLHQRHESVDLPALMVQSVRDISNLASRVQLSAPAEVPGLQTDRQLLKIVLTNLLSNAQRYSDEHTPIGVHVTPEDRALQPGLCVRVVNTPGLAGWPDERMIFNKYYRASGARRQTGSGLGLYLSQQLTQSLGGTLAYAPSEHHVEFVLWIPVVHA